MSNKTPSPTSNSCWYETIRIPPVPISSTGAIYSESYAALHIVPIFPSSPVFARALQLHVQITFSLDCGIITDNYLHLPVPRVVNSLIVGIKHFGLSCTNISLYVTMLVQGCAFHFLDRTRAAWPDARTVTMYQVCILSDYHSNGPLTAAVF